MGTYDYVNFECPHCGEKVVLQSKAFICECKEFNKYAIPLPIASDLQYDLREENTKCTYCGGRFRFRIPISDVVEGFLEPIKNPAIGKYGELTI